MKLLVYGIKNCNTMKKTFSFLGEKGIQFDFIDYKKQVPEIGWLKSIADKVGLNNIINTKGTTYRQLSEEEKSLLTDENKALDLLQKKSSMIKRPIIEADSGEVILGFEPDKIMALL
ncbi:MAG: Spx/MgsR family RNA polymerase-binding regulatory protein [Cyclobacteriaceae bacterium]|nr:Spx/MgsR family RNA polymerase-binding regulatory protein [Cyclobacteriaceae bacterium]